MSRENKEFSRGDKIRSDLAAKGRCNLPTLMDVGSENNLEALYAWLNRNNMFQKQAKTCKDAKKQQA